MKANQPTYLDYLYIMDSLKQYASPKAKLTYMIKSGKIIRVKRGIYIYADDSSVSLKTLANKIYGPSYISFEYALAYYGLIPERVQIVTSASMGKNKSKLFQTPVGDFSYQSINCSVYPYGVTRVEENGSPFLMASKEKALCDFLSKSGKSPGIKSLARLLYDDYRLDEDALGLLSVNDVEFLVPMYRKKIVALLPKFLKKGGY